MDAKGKLLLHGRTIKANLSAVEGLAAKIGNAELNEHLKLLHSNIFRAGKAVAEEHGLSDDADVEAELFSGGEDKPPQQPEPPVGGG